MRTTALITVVTVAFLIMACTRPEPLVQQVEVTREVERTVPVEVTVPVTRIVERTVEVEVKVESTTPVTRVVETPVEVTREVTREVPVTVVVTPTPSRVEAAPTPLPTLPQADPLSKPLTETTLERLQVYFRNYGEQLRAYAAPHFFWSAPDLEVFFDIELVVDEQERCDAARIRWGLGEPELICDLDFRSHTAVQQVSVQTLQGALKCERVVSDLFGTQFSCARASPDSALANIAIIFVNEGAHLRAYAVRDFLWEDPDLDVFFDIELVVDEQERCDVARIRWGLGEAEVVCNLPFRSHTTVQRLSVQTPQGDLRCARSNRLDPVRTYFFCTQAE